MLRERLSIKFQRPLPLLVTYRGGTRVKEVILNRLKAIINDSKTDAIKTNIEKNIGIKNIHEYKKELVWRQADELLLEITDTTKLLGIEAKKHVIPLIGGWLLLRNTMSEADISNDSDFKKWFNGSKVVDGSGSPLMVYHGTKHEFEEFRPHSFFTDSKKGAKKYGSILKPAFLKLVNPKIIDYNGEEDNNIIYDIEEAEEDGHDGLIILNSDDGYGIINQYIPFHSNQIRIRNTL